MPWLRRENTLNLLNLRVQEETVFDKFFSQDRKLGQILSDGMVMQANWKSIECLLTPI